MLSYNQIVQFVLFIFIFSIGCNKRKDQLQGRWIITNLEYRGESIIGDLSLRNLAIDFDYGSVNKVPYLRHSLFLDDNRHYETKISYEKSSGKEYLIIKGSKYFTDKFEISCLNNTCCRFELTTVDKRVECIYDGSLSPFGERRDCPDPRLFL